ncbi:YphA family membrane protein [Priestia flexa]|uniref:YphA family membrane protein n=1 Tax=Priestia flexa TaxID=86664 RepID=UPI003D2F11AF
MEGFLFYWFAWIGWIISTFFLGKTPLRWKVSMLLLISIMLSTTSVWVGPFFISYTYLFLLVMVCIDASRFKASKQLYVLFISLIVMFAYVGFCLLELYDPVWIFVNRQWLLTAIILYIVFLLVKDDYMRCIVILLGLLGGDFLYSLIVTSLSMPYPVGHPTFLDLVAAVLMLLFIWKIVRTFASQFDWLLGKFQRQKHNPVKPNN